MFDFFISHSSKDNRTIVDELADNLSKSHFSVWYDKEQINFGDNINREIEEGLKNSFCLVLIVTEDFFDSKWVFFEFGKYSSYQKARIIPIIFDISTEEYLQIFQILGNIKYINAHGKSVEAIAETLKNELATIKEANESLLLKDKIYKLHKIIKSQEDINSGLVSLSLNEFFEITDTHVSYTAFIAQKVTLEIVYDIIKILALNVSIEKHRGDFLSLLDALENRVSKNVYNYISFILHANIFSFDTSQTILVNQALLAVLQWYYNLKYPMNMPRFSFRLLGPGEMRHSDFVETDEIDYLVLRNDLIASVETAIEWYEYNNYTYLALREELSMRIAGYITLLPITEDTCNKILSGNFMDKDFTSDAILQYEYPGLYTVYVASVAIHPKYQNTNAFYKLYTASLDMFLELAREREIYVEKIIAEASTVQGEKLCRILRMKKNCSTTTNTDIYTLTLIPPETKLFGAKGKTYMNYCQQNYEQYQEYFGKNK